MIVVAGSYAIINNYPLHRECYAVPINEMFPDPAKGEGYFTGVPAFYSFEDVGWLCSGATPSTPEKLEDREVSLSAFWRRPKRVISGGGEQ